MKILVLGAGAVGGYFGGRLAQAGADVTFLVREPRQRLLAAKGLRIKSALGDYTGQVQTILKDDLDRHQWDLIILTSKAYDLDSAIEAIRPAVTDRTVILPLLNGIRHLDHLNDVFGQDRVLGGLVKIVSTLDSDGVIQHLNDWYYIVFGQQDGQISEQTAHLQSLFPAEYVIATAVPDIRQKMWEKVVHLATVAGVAGLMRASVGEIAQVPGGSDLLIQFLESNAAIARKEGFTITDEFLEEFRTLFRDTSSPYVPSLLRDLERRNPVESEHILGYMFDLAKKHGMDTTLYNIININLKAYEIRRAANRF